MKLRQKSEDDKRRREDESQTRLGEISGQGERRSVINEPVMPQSRCREDVEVEVSQKEGGDREGSNCLPDPGSGLHASD